MNECATKYCANDASDLGGPYCDACRQRIIRRRLKALAMAKDEIEGLGEAASDTARKLKAFHKRFAEIEKELKKQEGDQRR